MTIPTQLSLHGFIATAPELSKPDTKDARFFARVGVEHWRKEADGSFTKLDPTFHNLVMYGESAKRAYARFRVGDQFVASRLHHRVREDVERADRARGSSSSPSTSATTRPGPATRSTGRRRTSPTRRPTS